MKIRLEVKKTPNIEAIMDVTIDNNPSQLICSCFEDENNLSYQRLDYLVNNLKGSLPVAAYCFDSDKILDAASKYYMVQDLSSDDAGYVFNWRDIEDKYFINIRDKNDNDSVIHELIHLGHDLLIMPYDKKTNKINPEFENLEQVIETATLLFTRYLPNLDMDIKEVQINKVMKTIDKYHLKSSLNNDFNIENTCSFYKQLLDNIEKHIHFQNKFFSLDEEFEFNGIFNNYYLDDIKERLLEDTIDNIINETKRQLFLKFDQ